MAARRKQYFGLTIALLIFVIFFIDHISKSQRAVENRGNGVLEDVGRSSSRFDGETKAISVQDHLERSEAIYQEMVMERPKLMATYEDPTSPDKKIFPADSPEEYWNYPFTIWDFLLAAFNCPHSLRRLGRLGDGGKWLCGTEKLVALPKSRESTTKPKKYSMSTNSNTEIPKGHQPGCIIYSFGIETESSFEFDILDRAPNCQVWGYDPTVDQFGPQIRGTDLEDRAYFLKAGVSEETSASAKPPYYTIQDLMIKNGHDHIDVLKMDVEGDEFPVMLSVIDYFTNRGEEVPISQFLVEFHLDPGRISVDDFLEWWKMLERAGFRATMAEPNLLVSTIPLHDGKPRYSEYTFINIKDHKSALLR